MRKLIILLITAIGYNAAIAQKYPATKTVDSSDTWFNITVKDPYRWMEDLKSEDTKTWFKAQSDYTEAIMDKLPLTDELYKGFLMLDSIQPDKIGRIRQVGSILFYFNQKLGDSKFKVCRRIGETGKEEIIADYKMWGSNYQISGFEIDPYQKYIAITAAEGGKERDVVKFYNIAENKFLPDSLPGLFTGFTAGSGNVCYQVKPTWDVHIFVPEKDKSYYLHTLGTDTTKDKVFISYQTSPELYTLDNTKGIYPSWPSKNLDYEFIIRGSVSPYMDLYYRKINSGAAWKKMITDVDDLVTNFYAGNNKLFIVSKKNAPNGKLLSLNMATPDFNKATLLVPEKTEPLEIATQSKNYLVLEYMKNGVKLQHDMVDMRTNKVSKIPFVENTNLMYITAFNLSTDDVHILRSGWTTPMTYSHSNLDKPYAKERSFAFRANPKYPYTDEITVDEVEIAGHDGVMIPVSVIHKKGIKLNNENVAYVYSYGAYGYSSQAFFNPQYLLLAHKGIVIAVAHVRGGGEKGESWHRSGFKQSKPNTWKDLNSTAEWLISKGYTSTKHLACEGGSAGGILIGRAVTERPDLWACAVPQVGCLTMVRQEFAPNGPINTPEFGTVKKINEFFALMEMDALLHVQDSTQYPAMLVTTGWNDPRVISWQPAKFAAAVQKANVSDKPILLQVDYNGGHGDSEDKFAGYKKEAKKWAFVLDNTGYKK